MLRTSSDLMTNMLLIIFLSIASCTAQSNTNTPISQGKDTEKTKPLNTQIGKYVVEAFEDSKGNLWFGTMSKGVAKYDPDNTKEGRPALTYYTEKDGLAGNAVVSIAEDKEGHLWFGTHSGLTKYDPLYLLRPEGQQFTNYTISDDLAHNRISHVLIDSKEQMWVGTWGGVSLYDGTSFTNFPLPTPDIKIPEYQETANWLTHIFEDKDQNIWFSRSGYAVTKYDPSTASFTDLTAEDGLSSNCVQSILQDAGGIFWFGSRVAERDHPDADKRKGNAGLDRYDPSREGQSTVKIEQFTDVEGLMENDVYTLYEDRSGNLWFSATGQGVYRYDGTSFTLFNQTDRMDLTKGMGIQAILEDNKGNFWFGFSGGLFRLEGNIFKHVTAEELASE